ncbi:MAG: histidine kinase [Candidatus Marinimicrobia bacterium]|nr:histidine kinase [Candidatus Neomarinimicrobiota bacterium]
MKLRFLTRKESNFWLINIAGWSGYFLLMIISASYNRPLTVRIVVWDFLIICCGFSISLLLRQIYHRFNFRTYSFPRLAIFVFLTVLFGYSIWFILDAGLNLIMARPADTLIPINLIGFLDLSLEWGILLFAWSFLYFGIKFWEEWRRQRSAAEQAQLLAQKAQLQTLRYQLNPHFLFNTLNTIRALIEENDKQAKEMITELSEFLRYSLISGNAASVPLSDEIDAIRHYFAIEKKRYEEKLQIRFDVDPLAEDFPVLSFLVHPLVENAIKAGMATSPLPLIIDISAKVTGDTLRIEVCNTGNWRYLAETSTSDDSVNHSGLNNVRQRLENMFPGRHRFEILEKKDGMCVRLEMTRKVHES